ncbi:unnamed protein product [Bathycoccus prasinos]
MRILLSCCANNNISASTTTTSSTTTSSTTTSSTTTNKVLRGGKALSRSKRSSGGNFIVLASTKKKRIFIDGEAGTTGLQVRDRLEKRSGDIELIQLPDSLRKDAKARKEALNEADCAILCLPDAAAVEAVALVTNPNTVIIDASTAYRTNDEWTYGFPELSKEQREKLKTAKRISNPGCYPTGFIGLTKPLVENGFIPKGLRTTVNAVSGYTGGGKQLIAIYESPEAEPYGAYGFNLNHKHIPEMRKYAGLEHEPIFQPAVGSFAQGMLVSVPLFYDNMANVKSGKQLQECLKEWYKDSAFVSVREYNQTDDLERGAFLRADGLRDTNKLELSVFANDEKGTCLLVARLDNLGKGASGAAVQNLNLSLGLDESVDSIIITTTATTMRTTRGDTHHHPRRRRRHRKSHHHHHSQDETVRGAGQVKRKDVFVAYACASYTIWVLISTVAWISHLGYRVPSLQPLIAAKGYPSNRSCPEGKIWEFFRADGCLAGRKKQNRVFAFIVKRFRVFRAPLHRNVPTALVFVLPHSLLTPKRLRTIFGRHGRLLYNVMAAVTLHMLYSRLNR